LLTALRTRLPRGGRARRAIVRTRLRRSRNPRVSDGSAQATYLPSKSRGWRLSTIDWMSLPRHPPLRHLGCGGCPGQVTHQPAQGQMPDPTWRAAFSRLVPLNLTFVGCITPRVRDLQTSLAPSRKPRSARTMSASDRDRTVQEQGSRDLCTMEDRHHRTCQASKSRR
jgi:hypothetical protein